jgi:hypothetical protein
VGVEEILDRLVEMGISLTRDLVEQGNKVRMIAVARQADGTVRTEVIPAVRGGHPRWQDLGARVFWQAQADIGEMLAEAGQDTHAIVVSSRFSAPPPGRFAGETLTWIWLPPADALGEKDPSLLQVLAGTGANAFSWLFRLPFAAGADENGLLAQWRTFMYHSNRLGARRRLRYLARRDGEGVFRALLQRGDAVYRLEPGVSTHRLVGVSGGTR